MRHLFPPTIILVMASVLCSIPIRGFAETYWSPPSGEGISITDTTNASTASSGSFTSLGGGSFGKDLYVNGFLVANTNSSFNSSGFLVGIAGDSANRLGIYNSGLLLWGPGTSAGDTSLSRTAAGVLTTPGSFTANANLVVGNFVGIGTSSPIRELHIANSSSAEVVLEDTSAAANSRKWNIFASGGSGQPSQLYVRQLNDAGTGGSIPTYWDGNGTMWLNGTAPTTIASGQIALGGGRVMVGGILSAQEVKVSSTGADYVFENGYQLKPLDEVAAYVAAQKHLPGIATAQDMQTNGLPVSEQLTKQLAKIEELTLYMIEMKKENDSLKARVNALEGAAR